MTFKRNVIVMLTVLLFGLTAFAQPQLSSNIANVALSMTVPPSLTLTLTSDASVAFNPTSATSASASAPITFTENWSLPSNSTNIGTVAYFASATALIGQNSANTVPTSAVFGAFDGAAANAFTMTNVGNPIGPQNNASWLAGGTPITSADLIGSATHSLVLSINSASPLSVDTYSGSVSIVALTW